MASADYIPVGRTSLVKKGGVSLQVQTEYASRPNPRITTCISNSGQVVHKIERTLERAVGTLEEQSRAEATIKRQHAEVLAILQGDTVGVQKTEPVPEKPPTVSVASMSVEERLSHVAGVQRVFRVENDGSFANAQLSDDFKRQFAVVFKGLREILELFGRVPGVGITRQRGVYEVERDRLYFASAGSECYFVLVRRVDMTTQYEPSLKAALSETV